MGSDLPPVNGLFTVNTGSSSLKLALYRNEAALTPVFRMSVERIGQRGTLRSVSTAGQENSETIDAENHRVALVQAADHARRSFAFTVAAIGHRVVHGGAHHGQPERVTAALLTDLQQL